MNKINKAAADFLSALLQSPEFLETAAPAFHKIGESIAEYTAKSLQCRHQEALVKPKDGLIGVKDCARRLNVSVATFNRHFIQTNRLALQTPPEGADKRQRYVLASAFNNLIKQAPMRVIKIAA